MEADRTVSESVWNLAWNVSLAETHGAPTLEIRHPVEEAYDK